MTSLTAKTLIKNYFTNSWLPANPTIPFFDLSDYLNISDIPVGNAANQWIGLEFPPSQEQRISIGSNTQTRESGIIVVHCLSASGFSSSSGDTLADNVRTFLRWKVLNRLYLTDINTPNSYQNNLGDWKDFNFVVNYYMDA
jgi:hypothetical protein